MIVTQALAQAAGAGTSGFGGILNTLPLIVIIFVIFYFFIIRPQQKRLKDHQNMVTNIQRGDGVVTGGGIIAKVTKVINDQEIEVEINQGSRIRVMRTTISEVRAKESKSVKPADKAT